MVTTVLFVLRVLTKDLPTFKSNSGELFGHHQSYLIRSHSHRPNEAG